MAGRAPPSVGPADLTAVSGAGTADAGTAAARAQLNAASAGPPSGAPSGADSRAPTAAPLAQTSTPFLPRPSGAPWRLAITVAVALLGAALAVWGHLPLPWFTGPLLAIAAVNIAGAHLPAVPFARDAGQWVIGTALGLYFTPEVIREVLHLAPWVLGATAFMMLLGLAGAWVLQRLTGESGTTAFFACAIGGASEMAAQAERHGARVDRVAAAHSLRILLVALIVPFALQWAGAHGSDPYEPAARVFSWAGFAVLVAVTGGGAIVLLRLRAPNVFMIGPLLVAAALTGSGLTLSSLPTPVLNAGQLLIGIALGTRFSPEFFRAAPRYLAAVALVTLGYLAVAALFGWAMAMLGGMAVATAVLATTPGGIGEMALTAKLLKLGAPIVTAYHSVRMGLVVLTIGPLYALVRALARRLSKDAFKDDFSDAGTVASNGAPSGDGLNRSPDGALIDQSKDQSKGPSS